MDPFAKACAEASIGCDAGLITYRFDHENLLAAMVFAPEVALEKALPVRIACELGLHDALGALAPPELAVHLAWDGRVAVNGAGCGRFRIAASSEDPLATPDWLVVGLEIPLQPAPAKEDPGETPWATSLVEEGCGQIGAVHLLEAWARHSLVWINSLTDWGAGLRHLHRGWRGLCQEIGTKVDFQLGGRRYHGIFMGVDENFGMLLRSTSGTTVVPMSALLEKS